MGGGKGEAHKVGAKGALGLVALRRVHARQCMTRGYPL